MLCTLPAILTFLVPAAVVGTAASVSTSATTVDNLGKLRGKSHTYYVCPDCGDTLAELNIVKCLVCGHPKSGFVAFD